MDNSQYKIDNEKLNLLAQQYAETRDEYILTDLVNEMMPVCERDSRSWALKVNIPQEDLLSVYVEAVEEAAREYRPVSLFIQRYHHFKNKKGTDVMKFHKAKKRNSSNDYSLNNLVNQEEGETEFGDMIPDYNSEFAKVFELKELMREFNEKNPMYGKVIEMLSKGEPKTEIAHVLGEHKYGDLARKKVSLARKSFRNFIK